MKQLLILSGKGGTGKTTVAGAFIRLSGAKAYADCDVDAPNLHLAVMQASRPERETYYGLPKAEIDPEGCIRCGLCKEHCRFDAIIKEEGYRVDPIACEGCAVCEALCPVKAISMKPADAGEMMQYSEAGHVFSTAQLKMGSGTTGKLVTEVKKRMRDRAPETPFAVIDGSPGIGCPVIASLSGADMVLVVAEPSMSGISDMERIVRTARQFRVSIAVCVNKWDLSPRHSGGIAAWCREEGLPFAGRIPFDPLAVEAVNAGQTVVDRDCPSGQAVRELFGAVLNILNEMKGGED